MNDPGFRPCPDCGIPTIYSVCNGCALKRADDRAKPAAVLRAERDEARAELDTTYRERDEARARLAEADAEVARVQKHLSYEVERRLRVQAVLEATGCDCDEDSNERCVGCRVQKAIGER
jgi:hypothetical protein